MNTISCLKPKPSCGVDEVSSILLKHFKQELSPPLTYLIKKSFSQGTFPKALKLAKVFPKLKKNPNTAIDNYRPMSLLSTISKVFEKIALTKLLDHLSINNILTTQQHGFIKSRSTNSAIVNLTELILDEMEEGTTVSALFLDFSKAFDCLEHDLLLGKMKKMGIRGTAGKWMSSYLQDRSQIVELTHTANNTTSKIRSLPLPTNRGVPQGSVLGPVLFILLTNDLPNYLQEHSHVMMYADDTALLMAKKQTSELEIASFIALNMTKQYCQQNSLVLNEQKTQQLNFGRANMRLSTLPDIELQNEANYLGIIIDDKLTWAPHVDKLCSKLSSGLYVLKRIKSMTDLTTIKIAYFSLVESHLRYGIVIWGNSSNRNLQRVLVLQKKAIRILASIDPMSTCRTAFKDLKILTVVSLYVCEVICYSIMKNIPRLRHTHSYNTRHNMDYALPTHHLAMYEKKPGYIGPKLFNILPNDLKIISGNKCFKKKLQEWLLQRTFYSLDEFINWRHHQD